MTNMNNVIRWLFASYINGVCYLHIVYMKFPASITAGAFYLEKQQLQQLLSVLRYTTVVVLMLLFRWLCHFSWTEFQTSVLILPQTLDEFVSRVLTACMSG